MKTYFLLSVALIAMASCSKNSSGEEVQQQAEGELSFSIGIREGVNTTNLRAGDQIPIDITEITDTKGGANFKYMLKTTGNDATRHQVLGVDYTLAVKEGKTLTNTSIIEIANPKELPEIVIIPKVPGTFHLNFEFQKYDSKTKKYVGTPITKQITFSAVKVNFSFPVTQVRDSGFWQSSIHRREFKFSIDDGNREYDTYLSNSTSSKRYEYVTYYDGQTRSGEFVKGQWYDFRDHIESKKAPISMNNVPQTISIIITQHLNNGLKNIIKYENVPLEY